jgi:transcriptional regulator with XRE-family HTH domain
MEIGHKIKKIRELCNYTQEYMAEQLKISQEGYSKIEANRTKVSLERVEQIAKILKVDFLDLLSFDEKVVFNNVFHHQQDNNIVVGQQTDTTKDLYERLLQELKLQIQHLQAEITFLRELLQDKNK